MGYLSYANRQTDLLFEMIKRRYKKCCTIILTNRAFGGWVDVFPIELPDTLREALMQEHHEGIRDRLQHGGELPPSTATDKRQQTLAIKDNSSY